MRTAFWKRGCCIVNVLFVCTGNTCRSPMAAAIFNHKWKDKGQAKSVGIFAAEGEAVAYHSIQILKEQGIDLQHQSAQITEEHVDWAELILTMTASHKAMVLSQYPKATDKTFTIKEYVDKQATNIDVLDPYGGDLQVYHSTYTELNDLINRLFD